MKVPDDFADRLRLALKAANLSPASLGAAVGVDKSVVSRWLSARARPTQHNLARIADCLAERLKGFSVLTFEAPRAEMEAVLRGAPVADAPAQIAQGLTIPFGLLDAARAETSRRGVEYFGIYTLYYWSFGLPGEIARMSVMLQPKDGLIDVLYGAQGFSFRGWALLLLNRMYVILAEERFEAMLFLVTNAGQQPKARFISALLTGPAEGLLAPTASPAVLVRTADLSGDAAADQAAFDAEAARDAVVDPSELPAAVMEVLNLPTERLLQVPFATGMAP